MSDELYRRPVGDPVRRPVGGAACPPSAQEPQPVPSSGQERPARRAHRWGRLVLPLLALVVLVGVIAGVLSQRRAAPSGTAAVVTPVATPTAPAPPTDQAPAAPAAPEAVPLETSGEYALQAPGPGTVARARQHLEELGFRCEEEQQPGMDSWLCSHYDDQPAMQAYLGGAQGRRLGRISLLVQDGPGGADPMARGLQRWMVAQMLPTAAQQQQMLTKITRGSEESYAGGAVGAVSGRGAADGSVVLFVNNWVPDDVQPLHLLQASPLAPALAALGYRCTGESMINCTAAGQGTTRTLEVRAQGMEVSYLRLAITSDEGVAVRPLAAREARQVLGLLQGHDALVAWLDEHGSGVGGLGYANGVTMDWYPGSTDRKAGTAVLALREACWNDEVESC